jgi:hypothetical protein
VTQDSTNYLINNPMRNKFYLIVFSLLLQPIFSFGITQSDSKKDEITRRTYHSIKAGLNYGWLKNSVGNFGLYNYEFNLGYSATHYFFKKFNVQIQALTGIKIKKPYDFRFDLVGKRTSADHYADNIFVLLVVDEYDKILSHNHYYFEFPISFGYWIIPKLELSVGYSYRYYYGPADDFFKNNHEGGVITGLNYKITEKVSIGSSLFISTNNIYSSMIIENGTPISSTLKTRYFQIAFKYRFN